MNTHDKIVKCRSCGYVGPCDPTCCEHPDYDGATAEEAWQARAAVEADRQRHAHVDLRAFQELLSWAEAQICMHEETHRGGSIWEICDQCGAKWADDEGGKPEFKWPEPIVKARALLSRYSSGQPAIDLAFLDDLNRSRAKYPGNARMFDGLMGEVDELRRAYAGDGDIRAEAFDVAVCAYRIATEGDAGGNTLLAQPAASAEPAVWVAADTLYSAHPTCISSLAYMSQIDHDRGREYVPLAIINHHAAPVAQGPVAWPKNAEEVREFIGTNFISRKSGDVASDDDEYFLTAHDLLSAFDWWSDIAPVDARAAKDRT
jgi:hypothetical protein